MDHVNTSTSTPRKFRLGMLCTIGLAAIGAGALLSVAADEPAKSAAANAVGEGKQWHVHDRSRPQPRVVTPGTFSTQEQPGTPPSDAVVLFDGKDLSKWVDKTGKGEAKWKVENGYFEVAKG